MESIMEVTDASYSNTLLLQLNEQRLRGLYCDITIVVEDRKFKAHRNVLAASSPYFNEVFSEKTPWIKDQVLELSDIKADVFASILCFIYNSRVMVHSPAAGKEIASVGKRLGIMCLENLEDVNKEHTVINTHITGQPLSFCLSGLAQNTQVDKGTNIETPTNYCREDPVEDSRPISTDSTLPAFHSGSMSPIDLTSSTSRQPTGSENSSPIPRFQSPPNLQPEPPMIPSDAFTSIATVIREQNQLPVVSFAESLLNVCSANPEIGPPTLSADAEITTTETAKILYTLSNAGSIRSIDSSTDPTEDSSTSLAVAGNSLNWDQNITEEHSSVDLAAPELDIGDLTKVASSTAFPKDMLRCALCNRSFSSSSALGMHIKLHKSRRTLSCKYCNKTFIHIKRLQTHEVLCRHTGRVPADGKRAANSKDQGTPDMVQEASLHSQQPVKHMVSKRGHSNIFFRHRNLQNASLLPEEDHFVKVVDGHIIYFCNVCERSYMTLSSLKRHSNVHSWRRKYPCHYCDKVFALAEYRTKHEVWHTGERRYQCIFCWETFVTYYNLKTHQKTFHGINPGLICSEKTPNGGYKPKLNAIKLYRLLPMRSQKRPYKTYSQSVSDNVLLPSQNIDLSLTASESLDGGLLPSMTVDSLTSADLICKTSQTAGFLLNTDLESTEQDTLSMKEHVEATAIETSPSSEMNFSNNEQMSFGEPSMGREAQTQAHSQRENSSLPSNISAHCPNDTSENTAATVIAYGHPSSSVIVHNIAASSSSVISHNNQSPSVITFNSKSLKTQELPAETQEEISTSVTELASRPKNRRASKRHHKTQQKCTNATTTARQSLGDHRNETRGHRKSKSRMLRGKTMTYVAKPACVGTASGSRSAPLCQITVRIGEEAIVKRRISETDLMRDKSPSRKIRKAENRHQCNGVKGHRLRKHSRRNGKKIDTTTMNETCDDDDSDRDIEDQLWRPYYTYKPKRKVCSVEKVKRSRWRCKLRYKRSLRWKKRDDKTAHESTSETCNSFLKQHMNGKQDKSSNDATDQKNELVVSCKICSEAFFDRTSLRKHQRCHTLEKKFQCAICGKKFSTVKKLQKHELMHGTIPQFACEHCKQEFSTSELLEEHKKQHNTKTNESVLKSFKELSTQVVPSKTGRVGRKPSVRYTCLICSKVCKTAAALGRHMKRHETKEQDDETCLEPPAQQSEETVSELSTVQATPTTVITFSKSSENTDISPRHQLNCFELSCSATVKGTTSEQKTEENSQEMQVSSSSSEHMSSSAADAEDEKCLCLPIESSNNAHVHSQEDMITKEDQVPGPTKEQDIMSEATALSQASNKDFSTQDVSEQSGDTESQECQQVEEQPVYSDKPSSRPDEQMALSYVISEAQVLQQEVILQAAEKIPARGLIPSPCADSIISQRPPIFQEVNGNPMQEVKGYEADMMTVQETAVSPAGEIVTQEGTSLPHAADHSAAEACMMPHSDKTLPTLELITSPANRQNDPIPKEEEEILPVEPELFMPEIKRSESAESIPELQHAMAHMPETAQSFPAQMMMLQHAREASPNTAHMFMVHHAIDAFQHIPSQKVMMPHSMEGQQAMVAHKLVTKQTAEAQHSTTTHKLLMNITTENQHGGNTNKLMMPFSGEQQTATPQKRLMTHHMTENQEDTNTSKLMMHPMTQRFPQKDSVMPPSGKGIGANISPKLLLTKHSDLQKTCMQEPCVETPYMIQEYPLPLIAPASCRSNKEAGKVLASYPGVIPFGSVNTVSGEDLNKVAFYPEPYPLIYGHQLLAYPYNFGNLAALPVALNMVIPEEKGQHLPFLPSMFGYINQCGGGEMPEGPIVINRNSSMGQAEGTNQERLKKGNML
ncbi:zinc finger and BTB domain-containing protein 38-like [Protopterus annectens]|uniref:zinc finger and BTB domain-containing protein 38-like n=1 Tax=Protopterus annectens TaxID=7888 RepID=UPI001CF9E120|nr:zinc finger and BTB domain-containing protein 38-like [Protopterus annectens]